MSLESMNSVMIFENLEPERAIGTIAELLEKGNEVGSFGKHLYCLRNGKQVLLGHSGPDPVGPGGKITSTQQIFVSKGIPYKRNVNTWEELRELLNQGWVIGTEKRPGIKIWYPLTGRNYRRAPEDIFVIENKGSNE